MDYLTLKKQVLNKYFSRTNDMQKKAVFRINGAVLIVAGAGSGKTTVLCNRIANMLLFGNAYNSNTVRELSDDDVAFAQSFLAGEIDNFDAAERLSEIFGEDRVKPWNILAVTFTNKAAAELKERLENMGADVDGIWAATFHSACVRILRQDIEKLGMGYKSNFTIYDTDDQLKVIKTVMKEHNISDKAVTPKAVQNLISRSKDKLITPDKFSTKGKNGSDDYQLSTAKTIYTDYQARLEAANALDFDDIIMLTVKLFAQCPDVLSHWQNRFKYIMVDEYQDTNAAQYKLVSLLAEGSGNLCVVGDEDQSIYRFRGATIENILSFEEQFGAEVIKLEQNYRSTATILKAANAVIANNTQHKDKNLWSDLGDGDKIRMDRFSTEQEEAMFITERILDGVKQGKKYADHVILYRNNAQSRTVETTLAKSGIPYKIIGGVRFYERKEIKDIIAYLCVLNNNYDEVRFGRIVNEPVRGIGAATLDELNRVVSGMGISYVQAMCESDSLPSLSRKAKVLVPLGETFSELSQHTDDISDGSLIDDILDRFGYREAMQRQGLEGEVRLENINELKSNMITFAKGVTCGYAPLGGVIVSKKIAEFFDTHKLDCGLTYSAHPLGCAAGVACLNFYEKEHIMDKVKERGKQLGALLEDIKAKHKSVGDVRYIGLFSCVELTKDKATHEPLVPFGKDPEGIMGKIVGMLKAKGFNTYSHEACIFVCPPLIITEEELAENMAILDEVLTEVDKMV